MTHRIRLKGPWRCEWLSEENDPPAAARKMTLPADWQTLFGEEAGRALFLRKFHRPTNLATDTRVDLVFEGIGGQVVIFLNGWRLGECLEERSDAAPLRFPVADLLHVTNEIAVEVQFSPHESPGVKGGLWGLVLLEIQEPED